MIRILEREDTVEEKICWNYLREFLRTEEYEFPLEKKIMERMKILSH